MRAKKSITAKEALVKAQNLCAAREKCEADIRKKLFDWKLPAAYHDEVIKKLKEDQFIDEDRFAKYFVSDKFRYNKWGKVKIEFALKQKSISHHSIKEALGTIPDSDYNKLLENELIKKLKSLKDADEYTTKSKLIRFAVSRGFENGKVFDMVSEIIEMHKNKS